MQRVAVLVRAPSLERVVFAVGMALACGPAPCRAQTPRNAAEVAALQKDAEALVRLRNEIAASLPVPSAGGHANGLLDLVLPDAMSGIFGSRALTIRLLRREGRWVRGLACFHGYPPEVPVECGGLKVEGDRVFGEVAFVAGRVFPRSGRSYEDLPTPLRYRIDARSKGDVLRGESALVAGPPPGSVRAFALEPAPTVEGRFLPVARPAPASLGSAPILADLSTDDQWIETQATLAYEQIRAMEITRVTGLPFSIAERQVVVYRPERFVVAQKPRGAAKPSLDDAGLEETDSERPRKAEGSVPQLARVRAMRERVARLTRAVERYRVRRDEAVAAIPSGSVDTGDPDFGHWFGQGALPVAGGRTNVVAVAAGAAGPQRWQYVDHWRVTGPFPSPGTWSVETPLLPDVVPAFDAPCRVGRLDSSGQTNAAWCAGYAGPDPSPWQTVRADPNSGIARPPPWHDGDKFAPGEARYRLGPGLDWSSFMAFSEVYADEDRDVWMGIDVNDSAALWVDGRLAWSSGLHETPNRTQTAVFPVRLARGRNLLMLRGDDRQHPGYFGLWVCTQGAPRPRPEAEAATARRAAAQSNTRSATAGLRGWRGDGHGRFRDGVPVTAWDLEVRINVLWRTPMWAAHGSPAVAGDRLFVTDEPYFLVCLDRNTGRILWRRDADPLEFRNTAAFESAKPLKAALLEAYDRWSALRAAVEPAAAAPGSGPDASKRAALTAARDALKAAQTQLSAHSMAAGGAGFKFLNGDVAGAAFSTPATDGQRVWFKASLGPVACFDMEGNRQWIADTGIRSGEVTPSLTVTRDRVVGLFGEPLAGQKDDSDDEGLPGDKAKATAATTVDPLALIGWDAATGREMWRVALPPAGKWRTGSPVATRLTDGTDEMDVAITPSGFVVRTEDGKVLLRDIDMQREARKDFDTPTADGDVVYFTRSLARDAPGPEVSEAAAFRLVMLDRDRVGAKPLWRTLIATDFCGGVVVEQGRLYGLAGDLWVLDAQTGAVLPRVGKVFAYPPADSWIPTCAGKGVVVAADSWRGLESWPRGVTVIRTQPWPRVVARNLNDYMVAHPAMDGDRLYLRTSQAVACVARTGEAGARYEAEVNARTILGQMQRRRPDDSPPVEPAPRPVAGNAAMIVDGEVIAPWHVAGPVPLRLKEAARTAMGIPGWTLKGTGLVAVAGANVPHGPYPRPDAAARANRYDDGIDALRDIHVAGDTVSYWYAPCYVRRERVLRFEASQVPGVSAWLSDVPVRDGQRVRLKPGNYALVLEVEVAGAPPSRLEVAPRFWASDDPDRELREWLDRVRADRDILEAATRLLSETDVGRVCAGMLKASRH